MSYTKSDIEKLKTLPVNKQAEAIRRAGIIRRFESFCEKVIREGGTRGQAAEVFSVRENMASRTLLRWAGKHKKGGVLALVDSRGKLKTGQTISDEAFEYFKSIYLDPRQLSVKSCLMLTDYKSKAEKLGWKIPSLRTMQRYVNENIPLPVKVLHRDGIEAYNAKCAPYIETDYENINAGSLWVGDHHQFNCWVMHRGKWIRPWITAWLDMRSRCLVGKFITDSPNQTTILRAMKRGCEVYGPPERVKIDNGKDYDSQMWTGTTKQKRRALKAGYIDENTVGGLYGLLGIEASFSIPYHPQSKSVERWFDTLDSQFTKTFPTYCGKDSARKPENLNDYLKSERAREQAYTLEQFAAKVESYVAIYNNTAHTGRGMNGRSPAQVMESRSSRRVMQDGVLELLMQAWSGEIKVGKNGIRFKGLYYGQYDPAVAELMGKKVKVSYDPDDLTEINIYEAESMRYICSVGCNRMVSYGAIGEADLREGMRQKAKARRIAKEFRGSRRFANMDLSDSAIAAKQQRQEEKPKAGQPNIKPVKTPLDGQAGKIKLRKQSQKLKRTGTDDIDLDFDFTREKKKVEPIDLGLNFWSGDEER